MKAIQHIRGIRRFLQLARARHGAPQQIAYIGRQETLDDDWQRIRALLELPEDIELPSDPKKSHRRPPSSRPGARPATPRRSCARTTAQDYEIIAACERLRAAHGWSGEPPQPQARAQDRARRLRPWAPRRCPRPPCAPRACSSPCAIAVSVVHYADNVANLRRLPAARPSGPAPRAR